MQWSSRSFKVVIVASCHECLSLQKKKKKKTSVSLMIKHTGQTDMQADQKSAGVSQSASDTRHCMQQYKIGTLMMMHMHMHMQPAQSSGLPR